MVGDGGAQGQAQDLCPYRLAGNPQLHRALDQEAHTCNNR
jgi:hypothetical protein